MSSTLTYEKLAKSIQELKRALMEHKQAKERLARSVRIWQNTFDATDDAIWILDDEQRILRCNKSSELLFQLSSEEMIGRYCWEVMHHTKEPVPECPLQRATRSLKRESMELPLDRNRFHVFVDPILDENGKYNGAVHVVSDITGHLTSERAFRESEGKYRILFETTSYGVIYHNSDGNIISANPSAERLLGQSLALMQDTTSNETPWRFTHENGNDFPYQEHPFMIALNTGKRVANVVMDVHNTIDHTHLWINVTAIPLFRHKENRPYQVYTIFEDITLKKRNGKKSSNS